MLLYLRQQFYLNHHNRNKTLTSLYESLSRMMFQDEETMINRATVSPR